jgi:hypothetical protein
MLRRPVAAAPLSVLCVLLGCSSADDPFDRNRPATYGSHCRSNADCASPFTCLGPPDAGPYWPICTLRCNAVADCPTWSATGHCAGPVTPSCDNAFCDYLRCE